MAQLLAENELAEALAALPQWRREDAVIVRTVEFADFPAAIAGVAAVAAEAEALDHHPDIDIRWRTVTFRCSTHSAGGLTALDVALADAIDDVLDER